MRVLHIVQLQENPGGIENVILNISEARNKEALHFDYLTTSKKSCYEKELQRNGGTVYYFPSVIMHPFRYYGRMKRLLEDKKYDVVHIHKNSLSNCLPVLFCRFLGCRIVLHSHNTSAAGKGAVVRLKNMLHYFNRIFINRMDIRRLACSELAARWMYGSRYQEAVIFHNGINIEIFQFNQAYRDEVRNKNGLSEQYFVIGHIGRYRRQKNHDFLIDLLRELLQQDNRSVFLFLIGQGELSDSIRKKAEDYGVLENIIFLKETKETYKYYSAFDLFALPSLHEGLPLVGVEAQINGVPCLFSDTISEEVKLNGNAEFCPLGDVDAWTERITHYMKKDRRIPDSHLAFRGTKYDIYFEIKKLQEIYLSKQ